MVINGQVIGDFNVGWINHDRCNHTADIHTNVKMVDHYVKPINMRAEQVDLHDPYLPYYTV